MFDTLTQKTTSDITDILDHGKTTMQALQEGTDELKKASSDGLDLLPMIACLILRQNLNDIYNSPIMQNPNDDFVPIKD